MILTLKINFTPLFVKCFTEFNISEFSTDLFIFISMFCDDFLRNSFRFAISSGKNIFFFKYLELLVEWNSKSILGQFVKKYTPGY